MLATLLAVLAVGAVASASASAHEFIVEGKPITGAEPATGTSPTFKVAFVLLGVTLTVECKTTTFTHTFGKEGNEAPGGRAYSNSCEMKKPQGCTVRRVAFEFYGALGGSLSSLTDKFTGAGRGEELFKLAIEPKESEKCSLSGEYVIAGSQTCGVDSSKKRAEEEKIEHEMVCKPTGSEIHLGSNPVTFQYTETVKLVSGKKWSAR
jgi:hypothetical protein